MTLRDKAGIAPSRWGAICDYDRNRWSHTLGRCAPWAGSTYRPQTIVVHWGGGPRAYNVRTAADAQRLLQGWDRYHVHSRKWSAIAYNWAVGGGKIWRLRGNHPNGAHTNSSTWGGKTLAVVFTVTHGEIPLDEDRRNFGRIVLECPLPVTDHGRFPEQSTACAGPWLRGWIDRRGWVDDFGTWQVGDRGWEVTSIRRRLRDLGYKAGRRSNRRFTHWLRRAVKAYQADQGITVDGIFGPVTYRHATNLS